MAVVATSHPKPVGTSSAPLPPSGRDNGAEVAPHVQSKRLAAVTRGEGLRFAKIAPGHADIHSIGKQKARKPPTEHAVAADNHHLHSRRRRRSSGSGTAHRS